METDEKLAAFSEMVRQCPHNLMSKSDLEHLETRHIPECVDVANRLPACGVVGDLGSGGGFPGLVIAIVRPELEVHLIDSTRKKAEFLFDVGEALDLNVVVHNARAEELGAGPLKNKFPILTARAVARLPQLLTWGLPLVTKGGELWAIKGDQWPDEVREARRELRKLHAHVEETPDSVPGTSNNLARVIRISKH